ncbi:MAG: hypothetical protein K2O97_09945 [Acetatifactor sp.]|nr:hypothetical protein [Acetatifactor sp.]
MGASESFIHYLKKGFHFPGQPSRERKNRCTIITDLESIRLVAARLLGYPDRESLRGETDSCLTREDMGADLPEPFRRFLLQSPERDAGADFAEWDRVLAESYGERRFIPLSMTEEEIYSRSGEN